MMKWVLFFIENGSVETVEYKWRRKAEEVIERALKDFLTDFLDAFEECSIVVKRVEEEEVVNALRKQGYEDIRIVFVMKILWGLRGEEIWGIAEVYREERA